MCLPLKERLCEEPSTRTWSRVSLNQATSASRSASVSLPPGWGQECQGLEPRGGGEQEQELVLVVVALFFIAIHSLTLLYTAHKPETLTCQASRLRALTTP